MSYLLTQMFLYMLATFILGLLLGWLIWRYGKSTAGDYELVVNERDALRAERDAMSGDHHALVAERDALNTNLDASRNRATKERDAAEELRGENARLTAELEACRAETAKAKASARSAPVAAAAVAAVAAPAAAASDAGTQPKGLDGPRGGKADNLKDINGVGPKLEGLLHTLGYFHFDQIAKWTKDELAWVDSNLEGFKGRASRDEWVPQAKRLAKR